MPQTIADGLQRIIDAKTDIDGAIEAKDGTVTKGLENSDEDIMTIPEGATSYSPLTDKPAIDNHTLMPGNNTSSDLGLQTKLTFDSAPTENSTNPVTSGGVYTALSGKQATIDSSHKLSADNVDDTNATNKFATATQLQQIDTNKTNILIDEKYQGGVNLLEYSSLDTTNANGCTYTINDDKSITINRTATSSNMSYVVFKLDNTAIDVKSLCDGNHYLVGCPTGGQVTTYRMYATGGSYFVTDFGNGVLLSDVGSSTFDINVVIRVEAAYQASNLTFKPMIITKANYDAGYKGYQPYAMSNAELTEKGKQNDPNISWNTNNGVKNILDWTASTLEGVNGVDFIVDEYNKTVTVNGTCTAATGGSSTFVIRTVTGTENVGNLFKDCVLMGVPENANGNVYMSIELRTSPYTLYAMDSGYGMSINEIPANVGILIFIRVPSGKTVDNLVIKPMICHRSVLDKSYQPSALSNVTITPELIKLVDSGPKNLIEQSSGSDRRWVNVDCDLEPGTYVVSFGSITTTHTADSIQVTFFDSNWTNCGVNDSVVQMNLIDKFCVIRTVKRAAHLRIYASPTTITDKDVTFTNLMVCTKSAWDVSNKYVPYRPTYAETVDQVTATHNQANFNTNNGVKNFATINNFAYTGYYMDVPINGSLSGEITVYIGNITSTDTDASTCALLFIYTDDSSSAIHLINRGTSTTFSANTGSYVIKSIRIYPSDTWVHSANDTVTVTNFMVAIKSIYDEAPGYQPYAISNTRITPELIELVDSGAKNVLDPTVTSSGICTVNPDGTITVNGSTTSEIQLVIRQFTASEAVKFKGMILSGCPSGGSNDTYSLVLQQNQSPWGGYAMDTGNSGVINTSIGTTGCYLLLVLRANKTYDNLTFKPMICSKAAWDVSHAYVPYRPPYIGASDYATQTTGGTVRVWTTTSGGETTLHISNEAP